MPPDPPSAPRTPARAIWLAFCLAPPVYVLIAFQVRPGAGPPVSLPDLSRPLELALTLAALAATVVGMVMPRIQAARLRAQLDEGSSAGDAARARAELLPALTRWALFESIAIYGFVIVMAGSPASRIVPFAAVSTGLLLLHPPASEPD